ncbi:hypothetical protein BZG36_04901 [Bifiguratus adelaidae]|uniref:Mitochondrial inner membrane protease ATP23 n=1 Tax=Bifiguratus adelaidae TaxID=1938954 RepID=A0A261XY34_9FUNG|nr:hypothetical protein BZG36_04901 [Bifiguratus adelaidae]
MTQDSPKNVVSEAPRTDEDKDLDKFDKWTKSLRYMTGLGLSEEEKQKIKAETDSELEKRQKSQCEAWRDSLMKNSPAVTFMLKNLQKVGCPLTKETLICMPCDATRSGGFSPDHGILLCQNRFFSKSHQEDTMVHEMIHMYDHCRFEVDWSNCRHHACSEVRAASLSGDCRWSREIRRGFYQFTKQHQACVKRRAILSVKQNPACQGEGVAEQAVASVFESCFKDTRPFEEIY